MIEAHLNHRGRIDHVLVDAQGWDELRLALAQPPSQRPEPLRLDISRMWGVDVYRDECPCDGEPARWIGPTTRGPERDPGGQVIAR